MSLCLKQSQIVCKNLPCNQDVTIFKATVKNNKKSHFPMCINFSTKEKGFATLQPSMSTMTSLKVKTSTGLQPSMCSMHFH